MSAVPAEVADTTVTVPGRFNGPPASANGGYACGVFAAACAAMHGAEPAVTLLRPPPLDTVLTVHLNARRSQVQLDDELVATVSAGARPADPPVAVSPDEAAEAAARFPGTSGHPFPTCFVCGVQRAAGDGLRLTPGQVRGRSDLVACLWTPDAGHGRSDGTVQPAVIWAVLDCPGGWTADPVAEPMVLSRMTAQGTQGVVVGRRYVVVGRQIRRTGRTAANVTALYTEQGDLVAHAAAVWTAVNAAVTAAAMPVHS